MSDRPYILGRDVHLGERYDILDMARDCGCGTCVAILEDAARREVVPYADTVTSVTVTIGDQP